MDNKQNDTSIGQNIRRLRQQSDMTQGELAKELHVTRQALSNWERDINEPDVSTLQKLCCVFGVEMDELAMEAMKMEEQVQCERRKIFNRYDMAIGLFYAVGFFLGLGIFFVGGFMTMTPFGWAGSLFGGGCFFLAFGLTAHAVITLKRKDRA